MCIQNKDFYSVLQIRDVYPGSEYFLPGSASKKLSILTQKNGFQALGNMIRVVHPESGSRIQRSKWHRIPDPHTQLFKNILGCVLVPYQYYFKFCIQFDPVHYEHFVGAKDYLIPSPYMCPLFASEKSFLGFLFLIYSFCYFFFRKEGSGRAGSAAK
jgi:hypothetical protein